MLRILCAPHCWTSFFCHWLPISKEKSEIYDQLQCLSSWSETSGFQQFVVRRWYLNSGLLTKESNWRHFEAQSEFFGSMFWSTVGKVKHVFVCRVTPSGVTFCSSTQPTFDVWILVHACVRVCKITSDWSHSAEFCFSQDYFAARALGLADVWWPVDAWVDWVSGE